MLSPVKDLARPSPEEGQPALPPAHRLRRRRNRGDGTLACSVAGCAVNPRLEIFIVPWSSGRREVGYDNEYGKGDHRHFQGAETAYAFSPSSN